VDTQVLVPSTFSFTVKKLVAVLVSADTMAPKTYTIPSTKMIFILFFYAVNVRIFKVR
jgi:hypothetical protein